MSSVFSCAQLFESGLVKKKRRGKQMPSSRQDKSRKTTLFFMYTLFVLCATQLQNTSGNTCCDTRTNELHYHPVPWSSPNNLVHFQSLACLTRTGVIQIRDVPVSPSIQTVHQRKTHGSSKRKKNVLSPKCTYIEEMLPPTPTPPLRETLDESQLHLPTPPPNTPSILHAHERFFFLSFSFLLKQRSATNTTPQAPPQRAKIYYTCMISANTKAAESTSIENSHPSAYVRKTNTAYSTLFHHPPPVGPSRH